jgi:hypothetical protein
MDAGILVISGHPRDDRSDRSALVPQTTSRSITQTTSTSTPRPAGDTDRSRRPMAGALLVTQPATPMGSRTSPRATPDAVCAPFADYSTSSAIMLRHVHFTTSQQQRA